MTTTKPGLPTVEQVTAHERQYGGRWRWNALGKVPRFYFLGVIDGEVWVSWQADGTPCSRFLDLDLKSGTLTPSDQQGNPVGLVAQVRDSQESAVRHLQARNDAADRAVRMQQERDTARAQLEEAQRTIAELRNERDAAVSKAWGVDVTRALSPAATAAAEHIQDVLQLTTVYNRRIAALVQDAIDKQDEAVRDQDIAANEDLVKRLAAAQARIGALETEVEEARKALPNLYSYRIKSIADGIRELTRVRDAHYENGLEARELLGNPDAPDGKALRALVRAARPAFQWIVNVFEDDLDALHDELRNGDYMESDGQYYGHHAAGLAVLLARRGQGTEPAATDEPPCRACGGVGSVPRTLPDQGRHPCGLCFHKKEDGEPERRTCGACKNCRTVHSRRSMAICRHHRVMNEEREVIPMDAPPGWCPGFDPRD